MAMPEKLLQYYGWDGWMDGWDLPVTPWGQEEPKKLIEFGLGRPSPAYAVEHVREMEKNPFDGVLMHVGSCNQIFETKESDEQAFAAEMAAMGKIEWDKFTDNFVVMYAASAMDWFSEEDWGPDGWVLRNVGMCGRAAREGGCKGVCFDFEPYGGWNPWGYGAQPNYPKQPHSEEKNFAEFQQIVRQRGTQFISRLQEEFPGLAIHTFFLNSGLPDVLAEPDPAKREDALKGTQFYGLLPAFLNGMLDAADSGTVIHDGNECSYYYTNPLHYYHGYHHIRHTALALIDPPLHNKYRSHVRCAQAIFGANLCNLRPFRTTSTHMTPKERAKFVEHNVYWALKSSDRYVWFFSAYMDWWSGDVPAYLARAVQSARDKVATGKPLDFDLEPIMHRAKDKIAAVLTKPIAPRAAEIPRLAKGSTPPVIDGKIDDPAWNKKTALAPFMPFVAARDYELVGETQAWMTFDEENLYIGFLCKDPEMSEVSASKLRDAQEYGNDRIEVAIAADAEPTAYYHIMVDCDNERWDALTKAGDEICGTDSSWAGDYRTAAQKVDEHWSVEIAIPWKTLHMEAPKSGARLNGNLLRWRHPRPDGLQEFSSWSQSRRHRYIEAENFGTWVFE